MSPTESAETALNDIRSGIFVSDLHLFSPRSIGEAMVSEIATASRNHDCIVLGGDIFDFRWSTQGSHDATLQATRDWLENLLAMTQSPILFLPGNHDCHPDFLAILAELESGESRFHWAEHQAQIGDTLFLHGDVLDAGSLQRLQAYRCKFHHELPQSPLAHRTYDVAVGMRIHKLVPLLRHKPLPTCQRLFEVIQQLPASERASVRRVYFGHTHVAIDGLQIGNIQFYNPGAALRHMTPKIHIFQTHHQRISQPDA